MAGLSISQFARASKKIVPNTPNMTGSSLQGISRTQSFTWTPSSADWISIRMYHVNDFGYVDSDVICNVEDTGSFTFGNLHQNWISGDVVYVQFTRVYETETMLSYNNAESRIIGEYTVIGAGIAN